MSFCTHFQANPPTNYLVRWEVVILLFALNNKALCLICVVLIMYLSPLYRDRMDGASSSALFNGTAHISGFG